MLRCWGRWLLLVPASAADPHRRQRQRRDRTGHDRATGVHAELRAAGAARGHDAGTTAARPGTPAAALAQPPPPEPAPAEAALPLPQPPSVATAAAAPAPPPPPAQPPNEPQPAPPRIDLRGDNSDSNTIVLPNPQVLPASVNARFHNKQPAYPAEAQRRAEQGAVVLLIHVAPDGLPAGVDVVSSSGHALLDRAATDAVWNWHFVPATQDGQPVPFDMTFRIVFQLD